MDIIAEIDEVDREIARAGTLQAQCDTDSAMHWYYEGRAQALSYMRDWLMNHLEKTE